MEETLIQFATSTIFLYFIIPFLIMCSRIIDVSLGTIRIILANKGVRVYAAMIGFCEVLLWLLAITVIMNNLDNVFAYIGYATGFALGTFIGITIEEKIAIGLVGIRVITKKNLTNMIDQLKPTKYVFVSETIKENGKSIKIINAFLERKHLKTVIRKIREKDSEAFYIVEDLKMIKENASFKKQYFLSRKGK